jgi:hypothetical protein
MLKSICSVINFRLPEFSNLADGNESYDALASRIKDMLKDPDKQKKIHTALAEIGIKAPDWGCRGNDLPN